MKSLCVLLFLAGVFLFGCSPHSLADFQKEGDAFCQKLVKELQHIRTRDELFKAAPLLKERFDELVTLMIAARAYQQKHPDECLFETESLSSNEELLLELKRLYALEGGKDVIEKAQKEALIRLDAFERTLAKKRLNTNLRKN